MPPLYLNPEIGACDTEDHALHCITRTMQAYMALNEHVSELCQEEDTCSRLQLCSELGKASFISELHHKLDQKAKMQVNVFLAALSRGSVVPTQENSTKTLKNLNMPSPFLEYVLAQNGMALSFATDDCWERDFIEFNECAESIPNIWGQTDFSSLDTWIRQYSLQNDNIFSLIQQEFKVEFCTGDVTKDSFTTPEWKIIYSAFQKARNSNFDATFPLIKQWSGSPIYYIRDRNHSNFTIRIFFIKQGDKVYVGEMYHKNNTNTRKEESAAETSYQAFCKRGLFDK